MRSFDVCFVVSRNKLVISDSIALMRRHYNASLINIDVMRTMHTNAVLRGSIHLVSWWRHQMEHFPRYWPLVRGIHRSPVNSPHKGGDAELWSFLWYAPEPTDEQCRRGDLRRHITHYGVIVMWMETELFGLSRWTYQMLEISNAMRCPWIFLGAHNKVDRTVCWRPWLCKLWQNQIYQVWRINPPQIFHGKSKRWI